MHPRISSLIQNSIAVKELMLENKSLLQTIDEVISVLVKAFLGDQKVLLCGNGGSAADAQHIACELSGRFYMDRPPLFAEALHVNTSALTSIGNDYGFDEIYARMVVAKGRKGDVFMALSTSGNSPNVLRAIAAARAQGMIVVGMTGELGGAMRDQCDYLINIPSRDTPRIQECHIMIGHLICEVVEKEVFKEVK